MLSGCNFVFGLEPADHTDAAIDAPVDASRDAELGAWSTPIPIPTFATTNDEQDPLMSQDGLELYSGYMAVASPTLTDIVVSRRVATNQAWPAPPTRVLELSTTMSEQTPRFADGDRVMYIASDRTGTSGGQDVWRAERSSTVAAWSTPMQVTETDLNTMFNDRTASPCLGATRFVLTSERTGGQADIYEWVDGVARPIAVAASPQVVESGPFISEDCLTLYFSSNVDGDHDIYVTTRESLDADFEEPVQIEELSSGVIDADPWVSADHRHIIFSTNRDGTNDFYEAFR